jgi:hypothetical protein
LLILPFRGTLEAQQGILDARGDRLRAKSFEEPTPPAWGEDEVSTILDATAGRVDGGAGDVWSLLQPQWKEGMQVELASFGIELLDLEGEAQSEAKDFPAESDSLACGCRTFWLGTFYLDAGPLGIAFPFDEVLPDHLDRRRDHGDGTD